MDVIFAGRERAYNRRFLQMCRHSFIHLVASFCGVPDVSERPSAYRDVAAGGVQIAELVDEVAPSAATGRRTPPGAEGEHG